MPLDLDTLFGLNTEQCRTFQIADADQGKLKIYEHAGYRWLCTQDDAIQSIVRVESPAELVLPNHVAMLMGLLISTSPKRVLNLGFGTGAFERFFHSQLPATEVVSIDNNPTMVELARKHFFVPREWSVDIQTAEGYLEHVDLQFDFILCDIFAGERHPLCLLDASFYSTAAQRLTETGVLSLNLCPQSEPELISILLAVRQSFPWVMLIKIPRHGNIVLLACKHPPPADAVLAQRTEQLSKTLNMNFDGLLKQLERLPPPPLA